MTHDDWRTALAWLDDALDRPADEREAWLAGQDAARAHLLPVVRGLLADRAALESAAFLQTLPPLHAAPARVAHDRVGPWDLLRLLGEGGMASVWLARRADGAHRREVALKLPHRRPGMQAFVERFLRERAILSTLDHPNIAPVLDAGSDDGQPWLALAYVEGRPITEAAASLGLRDRLRLFGPVLHAVQHAHAQLVIHRDLKPANVLVTAAGQVQLLDFGVAKLLQPDGATADTALTRAEGRAMTLAYASPEQVAGRPLGVASDVYSLGVLLYEVLTGRRPYRPGRDTAAALEEAILAARLQPPSQAVAEPRQARALRGDIDTIVMKALEPRPADRYASAQAFADDLQRHLDALPIAARPASWRYRLQRFAVRRRAALATGVLVFAAMAGGSGVAVWQARAARAEAGRAEAVQRFLVGLLETTDPQQGRNHDLPAGELIDLNAARIDREFADRPDVRARLLQTFANVYVSRGDAAKGRPLLDRAIGLLPDGEARMALRLDRIDLAWELDDVDDTRRAVDAAAEAAARLGGPRWAATLGAHRAWLAMNAGQLDDARREADAALAQLDERSADRARTLMALGNIDIELGDLARAATLLESAQEAGGGRGELDRLTLAYNLARVRFNLGRFALAEAGLKDALPALDRVAGPGHDRTVMSRSLYAQTLAERGRFEEALAEQRANLAAVQARSAPGSSDVAIYSAQLGRVLRQAGRADEALPLLRTALAALEAGGRPSTTVESTRRMLAEALLASGERDAGIQVLELSLRQLGSLGARVADKNTPEVMLRLAFALRDTPRAAQALPLAVQGCDALARQRPPESPPVLRCRAVQAWLAARMAAPAAKAPAIAAFAAARERVFAAGVPPGHPLHAALAAADAELAGQPGPRPLVLP